jgi:hypothetical protein
MANFYNSVVQTTLLNGSETWTLSLDLITQLDLFHIQKLPNTEIWDYPDKINLLLITQYVEKRRTYLTAVDTKPTSLSASKTHQHTIGGNQ